MKKKIGIIADDLTGANDSGVQLTEKGISTSVFFDIPTDRTNLDSGIVIDTNSRALLKDEAILITKQASSFLKEAGYPTIYKKMDSTLRGHIGSELKVLQEVLKPQYVFIAPAFPSLGRTTKQGIHYVNGVKIADTEISKDPKHPVKESHIPTIIQQEIELPVGLLTRSDFTSDNVTFINKMKDFQENNITFIVCDAETQDDLKIAAQKMAAYSKNVVWAGSAGLAEVLPEILGLNEEVNVRTVPVTSQVMTVCGSLSQITQNQVDFAVNQPNVLGIKINTLEMFEENWETHRSRYTEACLNGIKNGKDLVLFMPSNVSIRKGVKAIGEEQGLSRNQIGEKISNRISEIVFDVTSQHEKLSGLVLTGGDTAKETARKLGAIGIRLIKQIEAGIPLGSLVGTEKEFTVVTKAGAFGNEDSIFRAIQQLKGVANQ